MPKKNQDKKVKAAGKVVKKGTGRQTKSTSSSPSTDDDRGSRKLLDFPVVGIGASAGGLDALQELFKAMPEKTGMAFIVVSHLDPSHVSLLPELLQKTTSLKVGQIRNGVKIQRDCVYIIPPNKNLQILDGTLQLKEIVQQRGTNLPIDSFFRSLAENLGPKAIAVILSGTGSDGTAGVRAVKGELGMVVVQDEVSAKYDGMPRSAINTGLADYILPPGRIPGQLIEYSKNANSRKISPDSRTNKKINDALFSIFAILRTRTKHDFSLYKKNTISRRIERRMNVHQINKITDYVRYLRENEQEVDILFQELLIGVTNFFRDPEAFEHLEKALTENLKNKPDEYTVRAWVPGCSTGEEVYSVAILLLEIKHKLNLNCNFQIFGTDIDETAISVARAGLYHASISADLSPERLKRFFNQEDDGQYRIRKMVREIVIFAPQNLIKDPPFTKLDLISCRNLLIYLGTELQKKLFPVFHYSLNHDGILFLGSSETLGQALDLFSSLNKKWKVYRKKPGGIARRDLLAPTTAVANDVPLQDIDSSSKTFDLNTTQLVETILQESNTPPSVVIDNSGNVVYIHGRTGKFLEPAEGKISNDITDMARPGVKTALVAAIRKINKNKQEVVVSDISVPFNGGKPIKIDLVLKPILDHGSMRNLIMVQFQEISSHLQVNKNVAKARQTHKKTVSELEKDLLFTRENLQTTIEELETSNEELKSANEELQSTNEELQSTNEEMETSKEELQSLNEESITVNAELQNRIDELSKTNDDMKNLLDSTDIATIFLDEALCLRRFTPCATVIVPLTPTDVGRPIGHFANNLIDVDITEYGEKVLEDLVPRNVVVESKDNLFYQMRVRPYRTVNNVIDGAVITFNDITDNQIANEVLKASEKVLREFMHSATYGFILLDKDLNQIEVNDMALKITQIARKDLLKMKLTDILPDLETEGRYKKYMQVIKTGIPFYIDDFIAKGNKHVELTAFKVGAGIGIIINDITKAK